jgi:hypothetical protein
MTDHWPPITHTWLVFDCDHVRDWHKGECSNMFSREIDLEWMRNEINHLHFSLWSQHHNTQHWNHCSKSLVPNCHTIINYNGLMNTRCVTRSKKITPTCWLERREVIHSSRDLPDMMNKFWTNDLVILTTSAWRVTSKITQCVDLNDEK